jgi:hypothetical protein
MRYVSDICWAYRSDDPRSHIPHVVRQTQVLAMLSCDMHTCLRMQRAHLPCNIHTCILRRAWRQNFKAGVHLCTCTRYLKVVEMHTYSSDWKCVIIIVVIIICVHMSVTRILVLNTYRDVRPSMYHARGTSEHSEGTSTQRLTARATLAA